MNRISRVSVFELSPGLIQEYDDGQFKTLLYGFTNGAKLELPTGQTYLGAIFEGWISVQYEKRERLLYAGDFFSVIGPATLRSSGSGVATGAPYYIGLNVFGGPLEDVGRLRYIDGCSDTLLIPPVRKGDPCLNHLHFPAGICQTAHTHPSVRAGFVYQGQGECVVPEHDPIPLRRGNVFLIPTDSVHSFHTSAMTLDVIAFHPDSDTGMTDDDHPMINRTIIDGVSASQINALKTVADDSEKTRRITCLELK